MFINLIGRLVLETRTVISGESEFEFRRHFCSKISGVYARVPFSCGGLHFNPRQGNASRAILVSRSLSSLMDIFGLAEAMHFRD